MPNIVHKQTFFTFLFPFLPLAVKGISTSYDFKIKFGEIGNTEPLWKWTEDAAVCHQHILFSKRDISCLGLKNTDSNCRLNNLYHSAVKQPAGRRTHVCPTAQHAHPHHMVAAQQQHWLHTDCFEAVKKLFSQIKRRRLAPVFISAVSRNPNRCVGFACMNRGPVCRQWTVPGEVLLACWLTAWSLTKMNGHLNGFHNDSLIDEDCFLFTSESVGEGHPGLFSLQLTVIFSLMIAPH